MAVFSAQDLLQRHGINYVATSKGKYTTNCPDCGQGYLNVELTRDGVRWFCHHCEKGGGEKYEQPDHANGLGPIKAVFDYVDEAGERLFQVLRFEPVNAPKQFRQRTGPDQERWSVKGVRIVLFRLPELIEAIANGHTVFIVEGEKDVMTLAKAGVTATSCPMGAGKWRLEFNDHFIAADVVICTDNDAPGRAHAETVARNLLPIATRVRMLDIAKHWPQAQESDDISDWFAAGGTVEALWEIVECLPPWTPTTEPPKTNGHGAAGLRMLSKLEFIKGFIPPDYLIEAVLQRRFIYALTGQTGHAKSAIALLISELVSSPPEANMNYLGTHRVAKGRVAYFVGENADDIRMRVIGADSRRADNPHKDLILFIPGVFNIGEMFVELEQRMKEVGSFDLIIVDTSAAYFLGNEELSNTQMGQHARMLRRLTELPGGPCVLVLCHPIKYVQEPEQLVPRGGGAFLAEVDGNLTAWKHDDVLIQFHHNKMRGPGFEPITFQLERFDCDSLIDRQGRKLPTVRAVVISRADEDKQTNRTRNDEDRVLAAILESPNASMADLAETCGWNYGGEPAKSKVQRILHKLEKAKPTLTVNRRGQWALTDEGKKTAREAALRFAREHSELPNQIGMEL